MAGGRSGWFIGTLVGLALLTVLSATPLPWFVIAPGNPVDLNRAVSVGGARPSTDRFLLTDVNVTRASPLRLLLALMPGVVLERETHVVPHGVPLGVYSDVMRDAMDESQAAAAVVAERAAGYRVPIPPQRVTIADIAARSAVHGALAPGDVIERVGDHPIRSADDVRRAVDPLAPGSLIRVAFERRGRARSSLVRTTTIDGHVRLGIVLDARYGKPKLAVPVNYTMGDIEGGSGGLMMALRIYDALHGIGGEPHRTIAGTGTIDYDGRVGRIEGTPQKLIAAKRAGASVFFVPRENYADVAGERGVRVVPVDTFADALRAL